ncbi:MAG: DUF1559 domain-containing protein [Planctomycetes bacterium]|nr:DUF1559 domain-containing protein [Planctomycetota bacterium]
MTTNSYRTWYPNSGLGIIVACLTICSLAVTPIANGQEPSSADTDAAIVQPFVSDATFLIVKVDPTGIGLPNLADTLKSMPPDAEAAYREISQQAGAGLAQLRAMVNDQPVYATVGIPTSETKLPAFVFAKRPPEDVAVKLTAFLKSALKADLRIHGDYAVIAHEHGMDFAELMAAFPASPREGTAEAFESVASYPVQVLLLPPAHVRRTVEELLPELPRQLGGGPSSVLTEGLQWAAFGIDPGQLRAELVIQSSSESAARDLAAHIPKMIQSAYDAAPGIHKQIPSELTQALIGWLNPQVEGQRIVIRIDGREKTTANLKMLAAVARTIEEKTRRHRNVDRFGQILLAIHNYYDTYKTFPPVDKYRGEDGKHHLSWRVHILPYVEETKLYNEFHLDEPWDSPHNKKLIAKMPDIYESRSFDIPPKVAVKPGHTTFLAPIGDKTVFGEAASTKFSQIIDGTSNTVVLVEVKPEKAVPWTAPEDYTFDAKNPAEELLIGADGRWLCGFADGSANQLRGDIPPETFLHLFQMNDGQVIDGRKIR